MSKISILRNLIKPSIFIFSVLVIYFALIYMQNGTVMTVNMQNSDKVVLQPRIYFRGQGENFSQKHTATSFKFKNEQYFFSIPKIHSIAQIRFDPTSRIKNNSFSQELV